MRPHHELRVWRDSMELATRLYAITEKFPDAEKFGLTSQLRRAAVSVPSNIAEGAARGSRKEFVQFLTIARGSLSEIDTQIRIAVNLGFVSEASSLLAEVENVQAALGSLIKSQRMLLTK